MTPDSPESNVSYGSLADVWSVSLSCPLRAMSGLSDRCTTKFGRRSAWLATYAADAV